MRIMRIIEGMRFKEIEKRLLADGWVLKSQRGSHRQYVHPVKPGKVTLPNAGLISRSNWTHEP